MDVEIDMVLKDNMLILDVRGNHHLIYTSTYLM